ncbi:MAG: hypothetical protein AB7S65_10155 [Sulfuricurvum sp.]
MYRMTYNHKDASGCSVRGIAKRETIDELMQLAEELSETICNVEIKPVSAYGEKRMPMSVFENMKPLRTSAIENCSH